MYIHKATEVVQVVNEQKQFTDVISDGSTVWVELPEVLFVYLAYT